jgi:transcriptional regulator GlxA family with amidase domain
MSERPLTITILVFPRLTILDAIGPYEVLSRLPGAVVQFAAPTTGDCVDARGAAVLRPNIALRDVRETDLLLVAGGPGATSLMTDRQVLEWLRELDRGTTWTTSVCTGSLLLAAAGLLQGRTATTHWASLAELKQFGVNERSERVVFDGKYVTAAGVSAGIDMALTLAARICGDEVAREIQLAIEYDPQPPFPGGSVSSSPPQIVERLRARYAARSR